MSQTVGSNNNRVYRLVLTGGPCGGKTTGQARLCTFFESIGWKVYRVPETVSLLASGGVKAIDSDLKDEIALKFYTNVLKTVMQIENTFFSLAASSSDNCLIICDGGAMDIRANTTPEQWKRLTSENNWNDVDLRDSRYNQVVHMVSVACAANGRRRHFSSHEQMDVDTARQLDGNISQAWVGHPYFDVIDNSTDFDRKLTRMIAAVCDQLDIHIGDRLATDSYKRKFLVKELPSVAMFPQFQDFVVVHDYLVTPNQKMQARIRRRGQNDNWTYTHTIRSPPVNKDSPELKMQITAREYELLLAQKDSNHHTVYKTRRCFLWNNQYFQMDIYEKPCHERCNGLILLETYTSVKGDDFPLPPFLEIEKEVTGDPAYSMYNLSKKNDVKNFNLMRRRKSEDLRSSEKKLPEFNDSYRSESSGMCGKNGFNQPKQDDRVVDILGAMDLADAPPMKDSSHSNGSSKFSYGGKGRMVKFFIGSSPSVLEKDRSDASSRNDDNVTIGQEDLLARGQQCGYWMEPKVNATSETLCSAVV